MRIGKINTLVELSKYEVHALNGLSINATIRFFLKMPGFFSPNFFLLIYALSSNIMFVSFPYAINYWIKGTFIDKEDSFFTERLFTKINYIRF